jgi:hypothetical protein
LILQTLDIKNNCNGVYYGGRFEFEGFEPALRNHSVAWKHSRALEDYDYEYLFLRLRDDDLSSYSPDPELFFVYRDKMLAHQKAALSAKVSLEEECFFDLLPEHQMSKWFSIRQEALEALYKNTDKREDYEILRKIHVLTTMISQQDIQFGTKKGKVNYDIFGSATGRLTTKRGSVPVLTLKKGQRDLLVPENDAFVELDVNAAEVRMLMALSGQQQPQGDIHDWVVKNVFNGEIERSKAKVELFAWLYNPSSSESRFDQIFSRTIFRDFFAPEDQVLTTPFGRKLIVEERKAQNYLLQSTTSDQVLENAYKIMKMLKGKKSKIAFTLHDSIIIDMCKKDAIMLRDIKAQFEQTRWGNFSSTCKIGKDFGNLRKLTL